MPAIRQITPMLHVPDLAAALARLTGILRFEVRYREPGYAYLEWGRAGLRILEEPGRRIQPDGKARMTVYLDVDDVDALFAELRPDLERLPPEDVDGPRDKPWRQRELMVRLPDGDWLAFGQAVAAEPEDTP